MTETTRAQYNSGYNSQGNLIDEVTEDKKIKQNTVRTFYPHTTGEYGDRNDPRDRRVYAKIPSGTRVASDTDWIYDAASDLWYKDITRDKISDSACSIKLDLGGIDLSSYGDKNNPYGIKVSFTIQPVVNGVPQTDLGPYNGTDTQWVYAKKVIPDTSDTTGQYSKPENDACMDAEPTRYTQTISSDYQASGGIREGHESSDHYYGRDTNVTYVPYALSDLNKKYIRDTHKVTDPYND